MKRKICSIRLIVYEIKNVCGNPFTVFFSTLFPILMTYLISQTYMRQIPEVGRSTAITGVFITMSMVVPMSIFLIGYGANYSQFGERYPSSYEFVRFYSVRHVYRYAPNY